MFLLQKRTRVWSFSVCLRSKRKMLGRKDSDDDRQHISSFSSSSSSPPVSPSEPLPGPMRPTSLKSQRSSRSESFKALLLRKGSRSDSSSRISAVERLRTVTSPDFQSVQLKPISDRCDLNAHLTLDIPVSLTSPYSQSSMFRWRQRDLMPNHLLLTTSCSSPFFFLSSPSVRPRSLTPPCSASRRFAARCHLYTAPMTAIFEGGSEEEEDDEVFIGSPGTEGELSHRLVEIF